LISAAPAQDISIMLHRCLPAIAVIMALGACMQNETSKPAAVEPVQTVAGEDAISVSVIDQRPEVVNGKESDKTMGTTRGTWGADKDIRTESGRPLAEDLTADLAGALEQRGIAAYALPLPKGTPEDAALVAFQSHGTERLLALNLYEMEIRSISRVTARWHVEATVYDRGGAALGRRETQGFEPIGRFSLQGNNTDVAMQEIMQRILTLLDEPTISRVLN
jgi:hypothetical protein